MAQYDLSILIPSRNEMFLVKTVENILANIEAETEIIVVLDGALADPEIPQHPRISVIYNPESLGQRAATNQAAKLSQAKYLMKVDAHCSFEKGFDKKMLDAIRGHDNWTMVPVMKNLHAFDWVCPDGHRRYQGPSGPCQETLPNGTTCGKETHRDILWEAKRSPNSVSYCFDATPHFQYFGEYSKRPEGHGELTETMSLQGSCFMLTRSKYWELDICDEKFGSWGSQGIEVAVKTWLSGGRVMVNHKTWYAHMFRTQGGDFSFPYPISRGDQKRAQEYARNLFFNNNWSKQIYPLSWLVEKFWPVKGWTDEDLAKLKSNTFSFADTGNQPKPAESEPKEENIISPQIETIPQKPSPKEIIFYTDNRLNIKIAHAVQHRLKNISTETGIPITSVSLRAMPHFGHRNIHINATRGYETMFKQILEGLKASNAEIIFLCEHDILYHPTHFEFTPEDKNTFYYNQNVWFLRASDGHALHYDVNQLSGLVAYREALLTHFQERYDKVQKEGFTRQMGFEPMTHNRVDWQHKFKLGTYKSRYPNLDIRHAGNLTGQRWKKSEFRNKSLLKNWKETNKKIHGWGRTKNIVAMFN